MRFAMISAGLLATAYTFDQGWSGVQFSSATLTWASRGAFAAAFLLAERFGRGRLAAAALILALVTESLRISPPAAGGTLFFTGVFLLPVNLAALALQAEWRVLTMRGGMWATALAIQSFAAWAVTRGDLAAPEGWLGERWLDALPKTNLPQASLLVFALAALVITLCWWRRRTPIEGGLLATLVCSFLAFELASQPLFFFTAAGLILMLAQIENAFALAFEDGLTGLPARRALEENLRHLSRRYAIAMVDIDHFKRLNDRYGHEVGDQVLRLVASRLAKVRGGTAYRYGGEEFTLVFPRRSARDVAPQLENLRRSIANQPFIVRSPARPNKKPRQRRASGSSERKLKVAASFGVADRNAQRSTTEQVLKAADKALYRSKRAGRNRLTVG